jgi:hypothetical protein
MGLLLMAFNAFGFLRLTEGLCPVVAHTTEFVRPVHLLGHFQILFIHRENFGVAVGALILGRVHVILMAERDRFRPLGSKLNISATHLLLLGVSHPESHEANDANTDNRGFPNLFSQIFTSFQYRVNRKTIAEKNAFI